MTEREEDSWRKFRLIAYEIYRGNVKHPKPINMYMQIGKIEQKHIPTKQELDTIWEKHGKLNKKLWRSRKN